jgi:hypothetical protein
MAQKATDGLMASGKLDQSGLRQLGSTLKSAPDVGEQAFQLKALGKQLEADADAGLSAPTYSNAGSYFASSDFANTVNSGKYDKGIATMHGDSARMLSPSALTTAAGRVSAKEMDNMADHNFIAMANAALGTSFTNMAQLESHVVGNTANTNTMRTLFKKADDAGVADSSAMTHWNPAIKRVLGR